MTIASQKIMRHRGPKSRIKNAELLRNSEQLGIKDFNRKCVLCGWILLESNEWCCLNTNCGIKK